MSGRRRRTPFLAEKGDPRYAPVMVRKVALALQQQPRIQAAALRARTGRTCA
jgi:hypothetical protein